METPLEITFHGLDSSEAMEARIREKVAKLERLYDRMTGCRVSVEAQHRQHRTGNVFNVNIEMSVPGETLVVSKAPHRAHERYAEPGLVQVMNEAFRTAERQLIDFKQKLRGEVKPHDEPVTGRVAVLNAEQDFGLLDAFDGRQLYFHRNAVFDADFEELKAGDRVHFVESMGETGPQASKVWPARNVADMA